MTKHYEFVPGDEKFIAPGRTVKRIRAVVAIAARGVAPGDLGGYIETEANLHGDAWVYGNAQVYGGAWVSGGAQVSGNAQVYGDAWVSGGARVSGGAWVYGNAQVYGGAWVYGGARVASTSDHLLLGPSKSSGRFTTAHKDEKIGVRVNCGCFSGSVLEFSRAIEKTHAANAEYLQQYRLFCQLIAFNFGLEGGAV